MQILVSQNNTTIWNYLSFSSDELITDLIYHLEFDLSHKTWKLLKYWNQMEARAGIEPANRGFAVPGLTTWLPRHIKSPLLSIDFNPLEQAKSLLHFSIYEILYSF